MKTQIGATVASAIECALKSGQPQTAGPIDNSKITRREFVKGLAATSTAFGCESSLLFSKVDSLPRIAVVGAGLAGLSAAYYLRKAGIPSSLFEGSDRIGGRIQTSRTAISGALCELGGEFIDSNHKDIWRLVNELGLPVVDLKSPKEAGLKRAFRFGGRHYTEHDLTIALEPAIKRIATQESGVELPFRGSFSLEAARRDRLSLEEYLSFLPMENWVRTLLNVVYTTEFGIDTGDQSSLNMLSILRNRMGEDVSFYGDSDERFRIEGGNDRLVEGLSRHMSRGVERGHRLVRVANSPHGLQLQFESPGRSIERQFDYVILALPFSTMRQIDMLVDLHPTQRRAIQQIGYGENSKLILEVKCRKWRNRGMNGESVSDLDIQTTWDGSRGTDLPHGFLTCYLGGKRGRHLSDGNSAEAIKHGVRQVIENFPELEHELTGAGHLACWKNNPWSQGSYSCYKVGQTTAFRGFESLSSKGLFFAGEHCSLTSKAFMNGAAESGRLAAEAIIRSIRS